MRFHKTTLPNGLRVIVVPTHDNPSATILVASETGSHYESKRESGLSHFLEHMLFKGTPSRPSALSVSTELDAIGAESNAFTANELTGYYAKSEKRHWKKLLEVVSDIYLNPSFPAAEIEKERGVILQELAMYLDLPKRHVWDVLAKLMYGDTPPGRPIIGLKENIECFKRDDFLAYHRKHYEPGKTIIVVAGDVTVQSVFKEAKKIFSAPRRASPAKKEKMIEKQSSPALLIERKRSDQTHLVMAFRSFGSHDRRSVLVTLLMALLGSGMSSRLFQRLREEMGACYYVYAGNDILTDHGLATIATGIDGKRIVEVVKALIDECKRLTYEEVQEKELQKIKDYLVSHMYMGLETTDALAGYYLGEEIVHGATRNPSEIEREIRQASAKELMALAKELFRDENLNLAIIGRVSGDKAVKKVLNFK